jgi:hypothetical protein
MAVAAVSVCDENGNSTADGIPGAWIEYTFSYNQT